MYWIVFIIIAILVAINASPRTVSEDMELYAAGRSCSSDKDQKNTGNQESDLKVSFTKDEVNQLFSIARNSIHSMLYENKRLIIDPSDIPSNLKKGMGAFVTLNINGRLRGCIGQFPSAESLYEVVNKMAIAAAFGDTRFLPVTKDEFNKLRIEISVIGPLKKIKDISEIVLGKHGIYIKKGSRAGTMLPQVATGNHWTLEQFLGYTSSEKAGLGWNGWKDADIYIYEAVVLEENRK